MGVPQTTVAFLDEAGQPEIPCRSKPGSQDEVFCVGTCFMGIHYWRDLKGIHNETREDFGIPLDQELKWKNLVRHTGPAKHLDDATVWTFLDTLVGRLDPAKFKAVAVTVDTGEAFGKGESTITTSVHVTFTDGTRVSFHEVAHVVFDANGVVKVEFDKFKAHCG